MSRTKATVDSSFPAALFADSPPRTMTLSWAVVSVCPQRALGPSPVLAKENHRRTYRKHEKSGEGEYIQL